MMPAWLRYAIRALLAIVLAALPLAGCGGGGGGGGGGGAGPAGLAGGGSSTGLADPTLSNPTTGPAVAVTLVATRAAAPGTSAPGPASPPVPHRASAARAPLLGNASGSAVALPSEPGLPARDIAISLPGIATRTDGNGIARFDARLTDGNRSVRLLQSDSTEVAIPLEADAATRGLLVRFHDAGPAGRSATVARFGADGAPIRPGGSHPAATLLLLTPTGPQTVARLALPEDQALPGGLQGAALVSRLVEEDGAASLPFPIPTLSRSPEVARALGLFDLVAPVSLRFDPPNATLQTGDSQLFATFLADADGQTLAVTPTFTTSNPAVGRIDLTGTFFASQTPGNTVIQAQLLNFTGTAPVQVTLPGTNQFSGTLSGATVWDNSYPVLLTGDILVPTGIKLTVAAGADIRVLPQVDGTTSGRHPNLIEIVVQGFLEVRGTPTQRAVFRSARGTDARYTDWGGIYVETGGQASFQSTIVRDAVSGVVGAGGRLRFNHGRIEHCAEGVTVLVDTDAIFNNAELLGNIVGLRAHEADRLSVTRCTIVDSVTNGMILYGGGGAIGGNEISRSGTTGLVISGSATTKILANLVAGSTDHGIDCGTESAPTIDHSVVVSNRKAGIRYAPLSRASVRNTIVFGNGIGVLAHSTALPIHRFNDVTDSRPGRNYESEDRVAPVVALGTKTERDLSAETSEIHTDPQFLAPDFTNFHDGNWATRQTSALFLRGESRTTIGIADFRTLIGTAENVLTR